MAQKMLTEIQNPGVSILSIFISDKPGENQETVVTQSGSGICLGLPHTQSYFATKSNTKYRLYLNRP